MSKKTIKIWGREFDLDLIYKTYSEEKPLRLQIAAADEFDSSILDEAKKKVEEYIIKYNSQELKSESVDNIFKYVMPKAIYVPQVEGHKLLAIMCDYKFDMEHGLAMVFEDNKLKDIGEEDIAL